MRGVFRPLRILYTLFTPDGLSEVIRVTRRPSSGRIRDLADALGSDPHWRKQVNNMGMNACFTCLFTQIYLYFISSVTKNYKMHACILMHDTGPKAKAVECNPRMLCNMLTECIASKKERHFKCAYTLLFKIN